MPTDADVREKLLEEPHNIMSEASPGRSPSGRGGRGGGGRGKSRGRGRGGRGSKNNRNSNKGSSPATTPSKTSSSDNNGNDDPKEVKSKTPDNVAVDPVEEKVRKMSDQVSLIHIIILTFAYMRHINCILSNHPRIHYYCSCNKQKTPSKPGLLDCIRSIYSLWRPNCSSYSSAIFGQQ